MPLFVNLPTPMILSDPAIDSAGNNAATANMAYFVFLPPVVAPCVITAIRVRFNPGGTGHYDLGIYADNSGVPGARLAHIATSATSTVTAGGILSPTLSGGNITVAPGRYWLAYWVDNITDKAYSFTPVAGITNVLSGDNGVNALPANANTLTLTTVGYKPVLQALVSGGWA
jgi:hypothetical protein